MDDFAWREEYKSMKVLSKYQIKLLDEGATQLAQAWIISAMHQDYLRKKGIKTPEPPDCSSSFAEFNSKVEEICKDTEQ